MTVRTWQLFIDKQTCIQRAVGGTILYKHQLSTVEAAWHRPSALKLKAAQPFDTDISWLHVLQAGC